MSSLHLPSLDLCLKYSNDDIINRFISKHKLNKEDALEIFLETKKWIWLNAIAKIQREESKLDVKLSIDSSLIFIDLMWHNFILFTREYSTFCKSNFGVFIHHSPTTNKEKQFLLDKFNAEPIETQKFLDNQFKKQCLFICEHLGENTLKNWYETLPNKYKKISNNV